MTVQRTTAARACSLLPAAEAWQRFRLEPATACGAPTTAESDFAVRNGLDSPRLVDLFALSEDAFLALTEGSAMRRIGYAQWQRNIAIALGNSAGGAEVKRVLQAGLGRVNVMVDEHIRWALDQLASSRTKR